MPEVKEGIASAALADHFVKNMIASDQDLTVIEIYIDPTKSEQAAAQETALATSTPPSISSPSPTSTSPAPHTSSTLSGVSGTMLHASTSGSGSGAALGVSTSGSSPPSHPAALGLPYAIQPGCLVERGPAESQQPVYPPQLGPMSISAAKLCLKKVHPNPRNVILEFLQQSNKQQLWLQIQLLTHTVVQIFPKSDWDEAISIITGEDRGYRIGLALVFKAPWVMAFCSFDNVFTPIYRRLRAHLPAQHIDVVADFTGFVKSVVAWAHCNLFSQKRAETCITKPPKASEFPERKAVRTRLAIHAIRQSSDIWAGVGVYTASEIMFMAGLSPHLTEGEVFDNPSRFARLIEAYYTYVSDAQTEGWKFISKHLRRGSYFLALKNSERLEYADQLYVYAKDRVWMPRRMKETYEAGQARIQSFGDTVWVRKAENGLLDTFEPTYIRAGLEKTPNLGSVIFGVERWTSSHSGEVWEKNPLAEYFKRRTTRSIKNFFHSKTTANDNTFLTSSPFSPLFLQGKELKTAWLWTRYFETSNKEMWGIHPAFPYWSLPMHIAQTPSYTVPTVKEGSSAEKLSRLFKTIVTSTALWAVGPTDYCGLGIVINGRTLVCRNDPRNEYDSFRLEQSITRRRAKTTGANKKNPKAQVFIRSSSSVVKMEKETGEDDVEVKEMTAVLHPDFDGAATMEEIKQDTVTKLVNGDGGSDDGDGNGGGTISDTASLVSIPSNFPSDDEDAPITANRYESGEQKRKMKRKMTREEIASSEASEAESSLKKLVKPKRPRLSADQKLARGIPLTLFRTRDIEAYLSSD